MLKDTGEKYGLFSKLIHWLTALCVYSLFGVGLWMVDLTYYSEWYKTAPHWHKSVGITLFIATFFRLGWKYLTPSPASIATQSQFEKLGAKVGHSLIYLLLLTIMFSGYLISTADNRAIEVFNWFNVPSLGELFENQEDIAGDIHFYSAWSLVILSGLHALAAIKHHVIDKDATLVRMIK